jgi:(R,R)-butanediol dehydrogenase / meso-butanediol dehydrogenase / diacetyl reductase
MKALRYYAQRDVRLDDIAEPDVQAGCVKVRVEAAGICGSDIHEYRAGPFSIPLSDPHPLTGETAPVVLGHEYVGTVTEVGPGVTNINVGDRVAPEAVLRCNKCEACLAGATNLCRSLGFHGLSGGGGGFAEFDVVRAEQAHVLPPGLAVELGAMLEPLATGVHAVSRGKVGDGQQVVVIGAGPIGLMTLVAARARGARTFVVEPSESRRATAAALGASDVLDPTSVEDTIAALVELTGGGAHCAIDTAGARSTFTTAVSSVRLHGHVVNVALWESPVEFNPNLLLINEPQITGALAYTHAEFEEAIAIAARAEFDSEPLVTSRIGLVDLVATFNRLADEKTDEVKVLVTL